MDKKPLTAVAVTRDEWYETSGLTRHREGAPSRKRAITITEHRVRHLSNTLSAEMAPTDAIGVYEYTESEKDDE